MAFDKCEWYEANRKWIEGNDLTDVPITEDDFEEEEYDEL